MLKIKGKIDNKSGNGKYKGMITLMSKSGELEVVKKGVLLQDIIDDTHMEDKKVAIIFLDQQITSLELNMSGLSTKKVWFWRVI